jgi:hypothetical protein
MQHPNNFNVVAIGVKLLRVFFQKFYGHFITQKNPLVFLSY